MLNCDELSANGGEPSRDSVLPSLPLVCSKKMPYPPRIAILPSPLGSKAKPIRGAGLNRCPLRQPSGDEAPTLEGYPGKGVLVPPFPPHWTMPFSGFPVPGTRDPSEAVPLVSIVGWLAGTNAVGSKLNACR